MAEQRDPEVSESPDTHRSDEVGVDREESVTDDKGDISLTGNKLKHYYFQAFDGYALALQKYIQQAFLSISWLF